MRWVARALFGLSRERGRFARAIAAFPDAGMRRRLEALSDSFVAGCHAALEDGDPPVLAARLARLEPELHGFAHEGAGLALALLDTVTPLRRDRFAAFLRGPGDPQAYMLHVGAGWALARLPVAVGRFLDRFDPLLRWHALDGYGFHEAFFRWQRTVERRQVPRSVRGYAMRQFDVGVGRRLWFTPEVGTEPILRRIRSFPAERQGDLWTGVGEASAFAGGRGEDALWEIRRSADRFVPQLGQGAAFSAKVRARGGNPAPHTDLACRILTGQDAAAAAALTDEALVDLPADGEVPAFEVWRRRIQERLR